MKLSSGSRAWGFESPNSDYDVRFIYVRPKNWYLSIDLEDKRDVIEYEIFDDIDLNGWDIRKALQLFWKSNPAFVEWINSPIQYIENGSFLQRARDLLPQIYSIEKGIGHYKSMAEKNYKTYIYQKDEVLLKKYFYALRPMLAARWVSTYKSPAPIEFDKLMVMIEDSAVSAEVDALLTKKKISLEKDLCKPNAILNNFIESSLEKMKEINFGANKGGSEISELNSLFVSLLN